MQSDIQRLGPSVEALSKDGVMDTILSKVTIFHCSPFLPVCRSVLILFGYKVSFGGVDTIPTFLLFPSCLLACLSDILISFWLAGHHTKEINPHNSLPS